MAIQSESRTTDPPKRSVRRKPISVSLQSADDDFVGSVQDTHLLKELATQFRNPGAAYRGKPFWSWNGDLDETELLRQVHVMKAMGFGGFFMHSRTGLVTEYLGDEWFRLINVCADEAEKLGMEAWLYDEDRWPSGTAGGLVTADTAHRMRFMSLRVEAAETLAWDDGIYAAFVCDLDGIVYDDLRRIDSRSDLSGDGGRAALVFRIEEIAASEFYNGNTYVDTMSRAATDEYLRITHDQYAARCGDRLGRSIRGIFVDEPHRGAVMSGFSVANENRLWMAPWTDALASLYAERFGGSIVDLLPELFLIPPGGDPISPVKWRYMELTQQLFLANFARPIYDWCERHDMLLTGHALHEDSLTAQAAMQGSLMRFYEYMHCPGVDVLTEGNRNFNIVKQLTSAARQLGQKWLLSELYGCTGWQMNFESHKQVGDWQALLGINLRCHHLSWYTMEGEAKRDFPGSILHQSAWWPDYAKVEDYFARLGLLTGQGKPRCDVLVLNPVESVWCQIHVGWAKNLAPETDAVRDLETSYAELASWLHGAQIDFDYGDEEMIARMYSIERGDGIAGPALRVGRALYRAVVVGKHATLRSSTIRLLQEFAAAGGSIVFAGDPPAYVDAVRSAEPARLAEKCERSEWSREALASALNRSIGETAVEMIDLATGLKSDRIVCQTLSDPSRRVVVALNSDLRRSLDTVRMRVKGEGFIEEWDCVTGERYAVEARQDGNGWTEWPVRFAPSQLRAFVIAAFEAKGELTVRQDFHATGEQAVAGPFEYALSEPNACVLDYARHKLGDGLWQERREALKVDRAVRAELGLPMRSGEMVQPWFRRAHPASGPSASADIALAFDFEIETVPAGPVRLAIERPDLWHVALNGSCICGAPVGTWVDRAFKTLDIPSGLLRPGPNEIVLSGRFDESSNIEAITLLGDFGVRVDGPRSTITALPSRLRIGDLTGQGLPFYGGAAVYTVPVPEAARNAARLRIATPRFEAACINARLPGGEAQMIAWQPYAAELSVPASGAATIELEVVLTRRNTFGPLHQKPLRAHVYGPGNWLTEGDGWSEDYVLLPSGLLDAPVVGWSG